MALPPPTFTVTVEPERKDVRINATPPAGSTGFEIWRVGPSGEAAGVRGWYPHTASGATPLIARDYEAPLGIPLVYHARARDGTGPGAEGTPVTVTVASAWCESWLVDLARPVNSLQVVIESLEELAFDSAVGVHRVLNRRAPVLTALPAWTPSFELVVLSDTLSERDEIRALLGSGYPFLLRTSPDLGIQNMYTGVTGFVEARFLSDGRAPEREFRIQGVQVERPDPALFVPAPPNTWGDVKTAWATWAALRAGVGTWDQLANTYPASPEANPIIPWLPVDV
jgi:hypothetical protein